MHIRFHIMMGALVTMGLIGPSPAQAEDDDRNRGRVRQIARWFSGDFLATSPGGPPISMTNCRVRVTGLNGRRGNRVFVHLEQSIAGAPPYRVRLYEVTRINGIINFRVRSYVNQDDTIGICDSPRRQRRVMWSNVIDTTCDVPFAKLGNIYVGSNDPDGCPTSAFGAVKVVSDATVSRNEVFSLDQFIAADGTVLFGAPTTFVRLP